MNDKHIATLQTVRTDGGCVVDADYIAAIDAAIVALRSSGEAAIDYTPGELDRTAPARVWLQIDTVADNDERDDPWPGAEHVTWQDESIGGLEIEYVRADLAATPASAWRPIAGAPEGKLCIVGWQESEDSEHPDRHDLDYLNDGCWSRHEDHVEWADAVAPAGSGVPPREPPYRWFIEVPDFPTPPASTSQTAAEQAALERV